MTTILAFMSIFLSITFIFSITPLLLALILVTQSILTAVLLYLYLANPWFSLMFLMIFVTAMMVLFIYTAALASSNILGSMYQLTSIFSYSSLFTLLAYLTALTVTFSMTPSNFQPTSSTNSLTLTMLKPFTTLNMYLTSMLIIYLLLVLIALVKATSLTSGPLRSST